jgi:hypothetical protein
LVPVTDRESLLLPGGPPITAHLSSPEVLAEAMRRAYQQEIADASLAARRFVERHHPWSAARGAIRQALQETADA